MKTWDWSVRLACALVVLLDESEWLERLRFRVPWEAPVTPTEPGTCTSWDAGETTWDGGATWWDCSGIPSVCTEWDGGATTWDGGATRWDCAAAVCTEWDDGATTWDGGATRWDCGG